MGLFGALTSSGVHSTKKSNGVKKISHADETRIKNILSIKQLDAMPASAAQAFQLASDPKATSDKFVKVIESDEALSARIVRIANSVYFFRGSPANDIETAVAAIGLNELRSLLSATMLRSLVKGKNPTRKQMWANAVATAFFAKGLAEGLPFSSGGEAFLCGLVHDMGKLIMIQRGGEYYDKVVSIVSYGEKSFEEAEEEIFEINHIEVGQWAAERWNFPKPTIAGIARHHQPWPRTAQGARSSGDLGLIVKAADTMAHAAGIGHPGNFSSVRKRFEEDLSVCFDQLGMSTDRGQEFIETYTREFQQNFGMYELE